ncbi:MAG TPA: SAM-dependent methyltransferase [Acidimicrobiia bacterium]
MRSVADQIRDAIHREGPIPFDRFMELALYGEPDGFFARAHGAGRTGADFVTSPERTPLFGMLVARALDQWWDELGRPDPFVVIEAGAGRGKLAADVLTADPSCAPALRYVLVERSAALRDAQRELLVIEPFEDALGPAMPSEGDEPPVPVTGVGPIVSSLPELPSTPFTGVVLANELLDNLPFRIVERVADGWAEVRVGFDGTTLIEVLVHALDELSAEADAVAEEAYLGDGRRLPVPTGIACWLESCSATLRRGVIGIIDYAATAAELVERGQAGWLRTYQGHRRGHDPLVEPGSRDITCDVPIEHLQAVATRMGLTFERCGSQAGWLRELGLDELAAEARSAWQARAHIGDLEAIAHRSRVTEAAALVDADGLGAHWLIVMARR